MFQMHAMKTANRLRLSVSAAVVMSAMVAASSASADTQVDNGTGGTITISSGSAALVPNGQQWAVPSGDTVLYYNSQAMSTAPASANQSWATLSSAIVVKSGASLTIYGYPQLGWTPWSYYNSIFTTEAGSTFNVSGDTYIDGTNNLLGDLNILDNSLVFFGNMYPEKTGSAWGTGATVNFGSTSNVTLGNNSYLFLYLANTATIGGYLSSASTAELRLYNGSTLVVNGKNTATNAYLGTLTLDAGSTFVVGDATHSSAVFGDPSGYTTVVNVISTSSSIGVLKGYGTIDGTVNNGGIVKPGGTTGTLGTLTINGSYTQSSSGQLIVEVSPSGASSLVVNGAATLDGSLVINLDSGTYGNAVSTVFSATSISGAFSTISTTGNVSGAIVGLQETSTGYNLVTEKATAAQTFGHVVGANRSALYQFSRSLYDIIAFGAPAGSAAVSGGKVDVWVAPIGEIENVGRDGVGYEQKTYGLSLGAEHRFAWKNAVLGGAFSYRAGNMDTKNETTTTSTNGYDMAIYGGADVQNARIDGMFFYNINDATSKRLMTTYGTAATDEKGWAWGASVQLSRNLFNDLVTPYLRGTFARVHQDGATESGTGTFDLAYNAIDENTFAGDAGVRIHVLRPQEGRKIKLDVDLAVRHDFSDPGETTTGGFATLDGSSFTYKWKGDSGNALLVGLNVSDTIIDKLEIFGRLNGSFSLYRRAGEISFGAKYHL